MTVTLVKMLTAGLALGVVIVGGSSSALAQNKVARSQAITIDPPGAGTAAGQGTFAQQGLNSGTIVGYYIDADAVAHGFIRPPTAKGSVYHGYLRDKKGNLTTFGVTGAGTAPGQGTLATGRKRGRQHSGNLRRCERREPRLRSLPAREYHHLRRAG